MSRIKAIWAACGTAILGFLAFMAVAAAQRKSAEAEKWKQKAVEAREEDVADSVKRANQALSQAKLHNAKAGEAKEKARKKIDQIGKKDPELAAVISGWRTSRLRDPHT